MPVSSLGAALGSMHLAQTYEIGLSGYRIRTCSTLDSACCAMCWPVACRGQQCYKFPLQPLSGRIIDSMFPGVQFCGLTRLRRPRAPARCIDNTHARMRMEQLPKFIFKQKDPCATANPPRHNIASKIQDRISRIPTIPPPLMVLQRHRPCAGHGQSVQVSI